MNLNDILFYIHIASLTVAVIGILIADKSAFAWMRGKIATVSRGATFAAHWIVTLGLVGLVLSGLALFWPMRQYLIQEPLFWLKMGFVAALIINSFFIEALMHRATRQSFASLRLSQKIPLFISGGLSTLCWLGAGFTALALF